MKYSTGKILCLILRSVVLSNLVLLKRAFIPQFRCLFRKTGIDFLRPENRTTQMGNADDLKQERCVKHI